MIKLSILSLTSPQHKQTSSKKERLKYDCDFCLIFFPSHRQTRNISTILSLTHTQCLVSDGNGHRFPFV